MGSEREYSMVQECVDLYHFKDKDDGSAEVTIVIPKRFVDLWITKLSELRTTDQEIQEYES